MSADIYVVLTAELVSDLMGRALDIECGMISMGSSDETVALRTRVVVAHLLSS